MANTVPVNVWIRGHGWVGPAYPDAEDPPGWDPTANDMPDLDELDPDDPGRQSDGPPPKSGAGSGKAAWAAYAREHDVEVADDADRGDIIAALDRAGVPTE